MAALSMIGRPSLVGGSQEQVSDPPTRIKSSEKGAGAGAGLIGLDISIYTTSLEHKSPEQFPRTKAIPPLASFLGKKNLGLNRHPHTLSPPNSYHSYMLGIEWATGEFC